MKLLLDAHVVLWWLQDNRQLRTEARRAIARTDIVWVSTATAMELALKASRKRLRLPEPLAITIAMDGFTELQLTVEHTERLATLPIHHGDPFDRVLVAQAQVEGATIVTHDRAFEQYGMPVIWT